MFFVDTEEEAKALIVMTCPMDEDGNHYARELAEAQTIENLNKFSDRLAKAWAFMQAHKKKEGRKRGKRTRAL